MCAACYSGPRIKRCASFVLALCLTLGGAVTAEGYYVRAITNKSQSPVRWMRSNCLVVRPNSRGSDDIADQSDLEAVTRAVQAWQDATVSCTYLRIDLREANEEAIPAFDRTGPNENVVYWVESGWRHSNQAAGITTVFFVDDKNDPDDGRILDADIELNGQWFKFTTTDEPSRTDLENAMVHELGHMMGLDHTCDDGNRDPIPLDNLGNTIPKCNARGLTAEITEATMYNYTAVGETKKRSPEAGDIAGICETYPLTQRPGSCEAVDLSRASGCNLTPHDTAGERDVLAPTQHGLRRVSGAVMWALALVVLVRWPRYRQRKDRTDRQK